MDESLFSLIMKVIVVLVFLLLVKLIGLLAASSVFVGIGIVGLVIAGIIRYYE